MKQKFYILGMKVALILIVLIFHLTIHAQICTCDDEDSGVTSVFSSGDGFESYTSNQSIPLGGNWSLYPASPSDNYYPVAATVVTNTVFCESKALKFQFVNNNPVDMRYAIDGWRTSLMMYIPTNKSAKISFLDNNNFEITRILFNANGIANLTSGSYQTSFSFPHNTWFRFSSQTIHNEYTALFLNYDNVASVTNTHATGYLNLYAHADGNEFYIDKICHLEYQFISYQCPQDYDPQCLNFSNITASDNSCFASNGPGFLNSEFHSCNGGGGNACENATSINCGETITSSTIGETFKFYRPDYGNCLPQSETVDFRAPDKIFKFTKTDNSGDVGIHLCSKTFGVDLDVFLLDECGMPWSGTPEYVILVPPNTPDNPQINCIASGISAVESSGYDTEFINFPNLPAGEYYIVVDGQHWQEANQNDDAGDFDLTLTCKDLDCSNATNISCDFGLVNQSLSNGANNVSVYCSPPSQGPGNPDPIPPGTGCTGKERVYNFTSPITGSISIDLTGVDVNEDFELFLLDNCDHTFCIARSTNSYGQSENIIFDAIAGHQYQIVVDGYKGTNGNFNLYVSCCGFPEYVNCANNGPITYYYSGDENNLRYTFNSSEQIASGYQWIIKQNSTIINSQAGFTNSTSILFPSAGNYEVCFPRINGNGCVEYCCFPVTIGNPFNCNSINYGFISSSNSFVFTAQEVGTNGQWFADNGNNAPTPLPGGVLPIGNCVVRTISYRYFDGTRWKYCCKKIYICNPFSCGDIIIGYKPSNNQYTLSLNGSNITWNNFSWTIDETNQNIGNSQSVSYVPPSNVPCKTYNFSIRYWDGLSWRICCISVYICDPLLCQGIIQHSYSNGQLSLSLNNSNTTNVKWYINDSQVNAVSNQPNGMYMIFVQYYDIVEKQFKTCKKTITLGPVSTSEIEDNSATVYPNPSNGLIYVESKNPLRTVTVYDIKGQLILVNKEGHLIDLNKYPNGLYIFKIETSQGVSHHKVLLVE